jgi:hypothetical protein
LVLAVVQQVIQLHGVVAVVELLIPQAVLVAAQFILLVQEALVEVIGVEAHLVKQAVLVEHLCHLVVAVVEQAVQQLLLVLQVQH